MCDPVSATVILAAGLAVGSGAYGAYEARQQRKEAEQTADQQAQDAEKARQAQQAILKAKSANKQYQEQADFTIGQPTNTDATTGVSGVDALRINPPPSALNIPGGQA